VLSCGCAQVYGNERAHRDDCFRSFNPTGEAELQGVVSTWTQALLHTLLLLPHELPRLPGGPLPLEPLSLSGTFLDSPSGAPRERALVPGWSAWVQPSLALLALLGLCLLRPLLLGLLRKPRTSQLPPESVLRAQKSV